MKDEYFVVDSSCGYGNDLRIKRVTIPSKIANANKAFPNTYKTYKEATVAFEREKKKYIKQFENSIRINEDQIVKLKKDVENLSQVKPIIPPKLRLVYYVAWCWNNGPQVDHIITDATLEELKDRHRKQFFATKKEAQIEIKKQLKKLLEEKK